MKLRAFNMVPGLVFKAGDSLEMVAVHVDLDDRREEVYIEVTWEDYEHIRDREASERRPRLTFHYCDELDIAGALGVGHGGDRAGYLEHVASGGMYDLGN